MEAALEKELDQLMETAGVSGVLCTDADGLCLGVRGSANKKAAGCIAQIASAAASLASSTASSDSPVPLVRVSLDSTNVLIQQQGGVTVAVYRKVSNT
mmetsp:Transcript_493/g.1700  ORF Transcript_493/g.1700 Transcript_493/m.1700 type:complete len:98 (-) Transcript_493:97-390(-)|eukprot:CAMPEP_0198734374 /NCGR_PEP_ID=MMETSP1475-20131203/52094_1 /TAXON_ID= ORGANISM="Unidentified sp., Strain CCMP1999" /NCGR_SAMPLE_ID=MMETSP1475 /ASSEMBLY_ACC=CAM_ASM_001111 /LENGTH=97 /DNA_ID=CAMNT_0044497829 /DNA_START=124 /DNA_END=417 /DNA_ORIENTATION=+